MNPNNPSNSSNLMSTSNSNIKNSSNRRLRLILLAFVVIIAGAALFGSYLAKVAYAVLHREGSSHGIFVPFLSAFFLWIKRDTLIKTEMRYDLVGIPVMLAGLLFPIFGLGPYNLQILGFIIFLSASVILLLGWRFFKEVSFPLLFLITLIPIPDSTYLWLAESTRVISFGGARWIISVLGIPFVREGNVISFHNSSLLVAEGCSGIRYLISYFVFSLAYAYIYKERSWSRVAVVCSSIVISLCASIMRLASIFILVYYVSPYWGETRPHIIISWCVFFVVLIVSISLDQHFQSRQARKQGS
jgi:exosortase